MYLSVICLGFLYALCHNKYNILRLWTSSSHLVTVPAVGHRRAHSFNTNHLQHVFIRRVRRDHLVVRRLVVLHDTWAERQKRILQQNDCHFIVYLVDYSLYYFVYKMSTNISSSKIYCTFGSFSCSYPFYYYYYYFGRIVNFFIWELL